MIIGLMQGIVCGIAFAFAGIEGPVFWGTLMSITSVIPPSALPLSGDLHDCPGPCLAIFRVIILLVVCGGIAGNLDNVVRPRLVGKDTEMHDLFILFSTLAVSQCSGFSALLSAR